MRNKNQVLQCSDLKQALTLQDEFSNYVGRDTILDENTLTLTILALPKRYKKKTVRENRLKAARAEKTGYEEYADEYEGYNVD